MHRFLRSASHQPLRQRGWTLLDALVALTVLSLGIMALARLQLQLQVHGRSAMHRAHALHLIADLHNRMLLNQDAAQARAYVLRWDETVAASDCERRSCSGPQLAQADLQRWVQQVRNTLPNGNARIFHLPDNPRQIGIQVAWAHQEAVAWPSASSPAGTSSGNACPTNTLCQLSYVEI